MNHVDDLSLSLNDPEGIGDEDCAAAADPSSF
jgi:hypothetical protein